MIIIQDKKYWTKLFLIFLFLLVICPSSLGVKPTQLSTATDGIEIKFPQQEYLKQYRNVQYNFHIFNKSNGMPLNENNAFCTLHLYNQTGSHIYIENLTTTEHTWDFTGNISGGNFSSTGLYSYIVQCNNSNYGGFVSSAIQVTYTGNPPPTDFIKVLFILLFVVILGIFLFSILLLVQHLEKMDFDLVNITTMFGIYFISFSLKYFNLEYMGSAIIDRFADLFIRIGALTHIILPLLVFIICFIKRRMDKKQEDV